MRVSERVPRNPWLLDPIACKCEIAERARAGIRNARAKGKRLGRPKRILNTQRISALRAQGLGWKAIAADMGVGAGTVLRHAGEGSKIQEKVF